MNDPTATSGDGASRRRPPCPRRLRRRSRRRVLEGCRQPLGFVQGELSTLLDHLLDRAHGLGAAPGDLVGQRQGQVHQLVTAGRQLLDQADLVRPGRPDGLPGQLDAQGLAQRDDSAELVEAGPGEKAPSGLGKAEDRGVRGDADVALEGQLEPGPQAVRRRRRR